MEIYGKSLRQIFSEMIWQQKAVVIAGCLFLCFSVVYIPFSLSNIKFEDKTPGPIGLKPIDPPLAGWLDPSIAGDDKKLFMAFSGVLLNAKKQIGAEVQISQGVGGCHRWETPSTLLPARADELIGPDGMTPVKDGIWRVETPSLVYNPDDKGREWKVYAYKYFWANDASLARLYGMIVYSYTDNVESNKWSTEEWLFSANDTQPPFPYNQLVQNRLSNLDPSLKDVYFYARPSVIYTNGVTLMSLSAFVKGRATPDRVILIASEDHGRSWKYLGTPLRHTDAALVNPEYTHISGATLMLDGEKIIFAGVFGRKDIDSDGTSLMLFDDPMKGLLERSAETNAPRVRQYIPRLSEKPEQRGGGFAAYHPACRDGILTSEYSGLLKSFRIFRTFLKPLAE